MRLSFRVVCKINVHAHSVQTSLDANEMRKLPFCLSPFLSHYSWRLLSPKCTMHLYGLHIFHAHILRIPWIFKLRAWKTLKVLGLNCWVTGHCGEATLAFGTCCSGSCHCGEVAIAFSSPEATILLVSTKNNDLWPVPSHGLLALLRTQKFETIVVANGYMHLKCTLNG